MLFGETVAFYCENHTEHTDTLCGQNAQFWCVKAGGTYIYHCALNEYLVYLTSFPQQCKTQGHKSVQSNKFTEWPQNLSNV
jgi:hypothetical protein